MKIDLDNFLNSIIDLTWQGTGDIIICEELCQVVL